MEIISLIWKNIPSIVGIVLPILIPIIIECYYRKIDAKSEMLRQKAELEEKVRYEEERKHNDHERRIQWTLDAYTRLYETALNNLENYGTIREIIGKEFRKNKQSKEYKQVRSYIDRIETFAKGFALEGSGEEIYDIETFKQISSPYFSFHIKHRVNAFLNLRELRR